jgi:hypothetical protein
MLDGEDRDGSGEAEANEVTILETCCLLVNALSGHRSTPPFTPAGFARMLERAGVAIAVRVERPLPMSNGGFGDRPAPMRPGPQT